MTGRGDGALTGRVLRGVGVAGAGYAATQALTLAIYIVLARLVTPAEFGIYTAASVVLYFGFLFTESGMVAALIQRRDRIEEAANTALFASLIGGALWAGIAYLLSPLIGDFFRSDQVGEVTAAMSGLLLIRTSTAAPDGMLERRLSFLRRSVVDPVATVAFGIGAIVAAANGMGVWSFVIGLYASAVVDTILSWTLARWKPQPRLASFAMWRELMQFGRHVIAAGIVERMGHQGDRALVGRFVGAEPLGQYSYAFRIASMPFMAILAIASHVLFPAFATIADDLERLKGAFFRALPLVMAFALPAGLFLAALGEAVVVLVFGEVWREGGEAVRFMCLYTGANALLSINLEGAKALGVPRELVRTHSLMTGATLGLMGLAIALDMGINGVAAALSIGALVGAAYASHAFARLSKAPVAEMLATVRGPAIAAAIVTLVLFPLEDQVVQASERAVAPGLVLLAAEFTAGGLLYLALLRLLAPKTFAELRSGALKFSARLRRRRAPA